VYQKRKIAVALCPCGSGSQLAVCCQPILDGEQATTATALMRSRYTAFTLCNADYLHYSWHPDTRPERVDFDPEQRWLGLKIKRTQSGGEADSDGVVCFAARYKIGGRGGRLEECSRFVRLAPVAPSQSTFGRWVYLIGQEI